MDGGYLSDQQKTRDAVIELARTMGLLLASTVEIESAISRMQLALMIDEGLSPETRHEVAAAGANMISSRQNRELAFQGLVDILTKLGGTDG